MARYLSPTKRNLIIVMKRAYTKEVDGEYFSDPGKNIEFKDGMYETTDKEEIEFLDNSEICRKMRQNNVLLKADDIPGLKEKLPAKTLEEKEAEIARLKKEVAVEKRKATLKEKGRAKKEKEEEEKPEF